MKITKVWIQDNLSKVLLIIVILLMVIRMLQGCKPDLVNPAVNRLEVINDSLKKEIVLNRLKKDSLYLYIDSLNRLQFDIADTQIIINKNYKNEVFYILNSDSSANYKGIRAILRSSDSLFKQGFYFTRLEFLGDTVN